MSHLEDFVTDRQLRGRDPKTIEWYQNYLADFVELLEDKARRTTVIQAIRERYENERSRAAAFRACRAYCYWMAEQGLSDDWFRKVRYKIIPAPIEPVLSLAEFERLLAAIPQKTNVGRRDRALYACLFFTGCRRDAIRLLKRDAVNLKDRFIKVKTKGSKELILPLPTRAALLLHQWLLHHGSRWCFPSLRKGEDRPICMRQVSKNIHDYARAAGITRRVHVHLLRHSFATLADNADVPIDTIQAMLGHASADTTRVYLHQLGDAEKIRKASNKLFG